MFPDFEPLIKRGQCLLKMEGFLIRNPPGLTFMKQYTSSFLCNLYMQKISHISHADIVLNHDLTYPQELHFPTILR